VAKLGFFLYHTKYIRCWIFRIEDSILCQSIDYLLIIYLV